MRYGCSGSETTRPRDSPLFTANAARQRGREGELGALASGFLADLVVVAPNPYEAAPTDLHRTRVRMTFLEGELVYEAE